MMTPEQRAQSRAICDAARMAPFSNSVLDYYAGMLDSLSAALDALDAETKRADEAERALAGCKFIRPLESQCEATRSRVLAKDRNYWKALALDRECTIEKMILESHEARADAAEGDSAYWEDRAVAVEARAEALERAAYGICAYCANRDIDDNGRIKFCLTGCGYCPDCERFQFDTDRLTPAT